VKYTNKILKGSLLLASSLMLLSIFNGCSDNGKKETQKQKASKVSTGTPQIEVVQNENAHEIKVKEKDTDKSQSKSYYYDYGEKAEYSQDAQPANKDASVRVRPRTSIDANMNIRSPYENIKVSLLVRKLSKKFIVKCSACHNDYANGIIGPSLLGKNSDYIFNKIADFKSGKKSNPLMNDLIKMMSDKEIRVMADEIYNFNKEINKMRNK
jgi:cytochrome c553